MGSARAAWRAPLTAMPAGHLRKGASSRGRSDRAARAGALARRRDRRARGGVFSWRRRGRSALRSELLGDRSGRNPRGQASKAAGSRLRRGVVQGWSTVYWGAWRRGRGGPGRGRHLTSATPPTCRTCPRHSPRRHLGTSRSEGQLCAPSDPVTGWTGHRVHPRCLARVTGAYARPSDSGVASVRRHCGDSCKNRPRKPVVRPLPPGEHVHVARPARSRRTARGQSRPTPSPASGRRTQMRVHAHIFPGTPVAEPFQNLTFTGKTTFYRRCAKTRMTKGEGA